MKTTIEFRVEGMHCASCGLLVDDAVEQLDGVERCESDVRRGRSRVTCDTARVDPRAIAAAINEVGYRAVPSAAG